MQKFFAWIILVIGIIYVINPTFGVFELIPDNLPFVGNIDEGVAFYLIFNSIRYIQGKKEYLFSK